MKIAFVFAALCCAIALPALADGPAAASPAASTERPADAIDSVILTDGDVVRGVVLSADETSVIVRLRSGEEKVIPRSQVRMLNEWKRAAPLPPAPPHRDAPLSIADDGTGALAAPGGVKTQLSPVEVYRLVGRDDLAQGLERRIDGQRAVIIGGGALATLGFVALAADLVYSLDHICFTEDFYCAGPNHTISSGLLYGGFAGIVIGAAIASVGAAGMHPDAGGVEERRTLADGYNARVAPAGANSETAPAPGPSPLATLRATPLISANTRGLALGISF